MKKLRIAELEITCFRGATNRAAIKFDTTKPLVVIFGENGTGKSTIVDAIDLIANGKVGSLDARSSAKISHAPAIGKTQSDIAITLVSGSGRWQGRLKGSKPQVTPAEGRPVIDILRRAQLLQLVEAIPSKRYESLQRFIDVSGIEASENQLERAVKSANSDTALANDRSLNAEEKLNSLWKDNGKPLGNWRAWAESKKDLSTASLEKTIKEIDALLDSCRAYTECKAAFGAAEAIASAAERDVQQIIKERDAALMSWSSHTPQLIETLTVASSLISGGWNEGSCPVCQQPIDSAALNNRVAEALASVRSLKASHDREVQARRVLDSSTVAAAEKKAKLLQAMRHVIRQFSQSDHEVVRVAECDFTSLKTLAERDEIQDADLTMLATACDRLSDLKNRLSTALDECQRDKYQLHTVQSEFSAFEKSSKDARHALALHRKLAEALDCVRSLRIKFVQNILDEVSTEADRLYQLIHPNESARAVRFTLDEAKRASLNQYGEFAGHPNIEPQGYYSDSHLDTLGFCLWLALAKRVAPAEKVVILDDVFTSVDVSHLSRIIDVIDSECDNFAQMLILTHSRNWFDRYRFNLAVSGKAHKVELRRWTPAAGVRTGWTSGEVKEIEELAAQFATDGGAAMRQELASRCGILLESILGIISKQYRTSVPNTPDGLYTLNDLLGSCTKVIKVLEVRRHSDPIEAANESQCIAAHLAAQLTALKELAVTIRNGIGCHFNQVAAQLSDVDVDRFAQATISFARAVICSNDDCGQIPQRDEASYHRCNCKRTRLVLTKQP